MVEKHFKCECDSKTKLLLLFLSFYPLQEFMSNFFCCWLIVFEQKRMKFKLMVFEIHLNFVVLLLLYVADFISRKKNCVTKVSVHHLNKGMDGWLGSWHESWIHYNFVHMLCCIVPFNARFFGRFSRRASSIHYFLFYTYWEPSIDFLSSLISPHILWVWIVQCNVVCLICIYFIYI